MPIKPRAFVVMAYGARNIPKSDGTTEHVDFNELYTSLLKPGLEAAGCEAFRADEEVKVGSIHTDMFFELITADVVLAEVAATNVNVYYELGVRHAAHPDGAIIFHGGGITLPFDINGDRVFKYDGSLWHSAVPRDEQWKQRIQAEVTKLGNIVRSCLERRTQGMGSPVYERLHGLKPVDWSKVDTTQARYFNLQHDDWAARVASARKENRVADILTLAEDAPTRLHQCKLLGAAAKSLQALQQFEFALQINEEILADTRDDFDAHCRRGLVLNRLGRSAEAEAEVQYLQAHEAGHPEVEGLLGRIYKDLWVGNWIGETDLGDRQAKAADFSANAKSAVQSYQVAACNDLNNYFTGVNVLTLSALLRHLKGIGLDPAMPEPDLYDELLPATWCAARHACRTLDEAKEDYIWALATMGELELLENKESAVTKYRDAGGHKRCTPFQLDSMLTQLRIIHALGFNAGIAEKCIDTLEKRKAGFPRPVVYDKVFVFSGHMVDADTREVPRFPKEKVDAVKARLGAQLDERQAGKGDLGICGGASGGDLLFAEACLERGVTVQLLIAKPLGVFLDESVRPAGREWEQRYHAVAGRSQVINQRDRLGDPPPNTNAFARNNRWMLNVARVQGRPGKLYALRVWDGKDKGDGDGGTAHFNSLAKRMEAMLEEAINPMKL